MDIRQDVIGHGETPSPHGPPWPKDSLARVPYWVYQDEANYQRELRRIFEGPTWNFVCLEADIPKPGDYRTNHVGSMPVIVVRTPDGTINCFENRCAHRGALIAFDDNGNVEHNFKCIYHSWSYDLAGNLKATAFERGIAGVGGMPRDFQRERRTARASSGWRRSAAWCSRPCRPTRRRSRNTSAMRYWAACAVCSKDRCVSWVASPSRCRTTGSSTSRTSRTPITPACCTLSSLPSASRG